MARSGSRLSSTFDLPGQPAYETNAAIAPTFGSGDDELPLVAVRAGHLRFPRMHPNGLAGNDARAIWAGHRAQSASDKAG